VAIIFFSAMLERSGSSAQKVNPSGGESFLTEVGALLEKLPVNLAICPISSILRRFFAEKIELDEWLGICKSLNSKEKRKCIQRLW
jgi:hypothetical protein